MQMLLPLWIALYSVFLTLYSSRFKVLMKLPLLSFTAMDDDDLEYITSNPFMACHRCGSAILNQRNIDNWSFI